MPEQFISLPDLHEPAQGEALCRLCARENGSCCRTDPDLTHLSFPLSLPEWWRLTPYSRLAAPTGEEPFVPEEAYWRPEPPEPSASGSPPAGGDRVCAEEDNRPDFIASMHSLFPGEKKRIEALFPAGGRHLTLRTRVDGACVFLGNSGCRLPRSVRPWYCLLFPAWIARDSLTLFSPADCLVSRKARGPAHGIALLHSSAGIVREYHSRLCGDWGLAVPQSP